ncbi:MAG: glycine--tRNA ligase [Patescibacteria group bacterium]
MTNLEQLTSLTKRRGFIYPGSEIYGGLAGTFDYGPYGLALKNNVKKLWWQRFVQTREDMYGLDAAILMNKKVWEASGHASGFADPLADGTRFNTMFQTSIGVGETASTAYLRPETAQGMFVNFKNIVDSFHPKLPFGLAQIGKAFRNEIAPRDFIFRLRELEQMEIEYFVRPENWEEHFEHFRLQMHEWMKDIGLQADHVHELEVSAEDRAHYSKRTIDFEFDFPFGRKELYGLAYRTDYDLRAHQLDYQDEETKTKLVPHVIEPSFGIDRTILAILSDAYTEDELGGEPRTYLKLNSAVAPIKAAVFPLLKNKPDLVNKAREVYQNLKQQIPEIMFDDNGNIGKRYRRQDEIGTPHCLTIDFQTLEDNTVTIRHRDTGEQERIVMSEIANKLII